MIDRFLVRVRVDALDKPAGGASQKAKRCPRGRNAESRILQECEQISTPGSAEVVPISAFAANPGRGASARQLAAAPQERQQQGWKMAGNSVAAYQA
jgi:hypothetical protein